MGDGSSTSWRPREKGPGSPVRGGAAASSRHLLYFLATWRLPHLRSQFLPALLSTHILQGPMAWDPLTDTHEKHMDSAHSSPPRCRCSPGAECVSSQLPHSLSIASPLQESRVP